MQAYKGQGIHMVFDECRTEDGEGLMQYRMDAGQDGCRRGWMQDRMDAGQGAYIIRRILGLKGQCDEIFWHFFIS